MWLAALPTAWYWVIGSVYGIADVVNACTSRRIQPEVPRPNAAEWRDLIGRLLWNTLIVEIPFIFLFVFVAMPAVGYCGSERLSISADIVPAWIHAGKTTSVQPLAAMLESAGADCAANTPAGWQVAAAFAWSLLWVDFTFFGAHYALHKLPGAYRAIHKLHHRFTAPCALAAKYAHPIEHFVGNLIPVTCGPMLLGAHPLVSVLWVLMGLTSTMNAHSGYYLPFLPPGHRHDRHHEFFNVEYGSGLGFSDMLAGTRWEHYMARHAGKKQKAA